MKRFLIAAAFVFISLLTQTSLAVAENDYVDTFELLTVHLWPEYDRPDILVNHEITLPASQMLPARIIFNIPENTLSIDSITMDTQTGPAALNQYHIFQQNNQLYLEFEVTERNFSIQYYDTLTHLETEHFFQYEYNWLNHQILVKRLKVNIKEPVQAIYFHTIPKMANLGLDENGQVLHQYTKSEGIALNELFQLNLNYQRLNRLLSVGLEFAEPVSSLQNIQQEIHASTSVRRYIIGSAVLSLSLISATIIWIWIERKHQKIVRTRSKLPKTTYNSTAPAQLCPACGLRINADDQFCRNCGTSLKKKKKQEKN
ncbi:MAG: zinc ribbon domain-containing protein [Anaerolineaceae bacterium]|nr:zinc ribbon domain-containing protein [Anaerolineaceae bacterium]